MEDVLIRENPIFFDTFISATLFFLKGSLAPPFTNLYLALSVSIPELQRNKGNFPLDEKDTFNCGQA